ncbi:MAG: NADH-quinone oxidoreductase subunit N [Isosphaeraceae bacterium]
MTLNFRDVFFLAPALVLAAWGLLVLLVDVFLARSMSLTARRQTVGVLSLVGVGVALFSAIVVYWVPISLQANAEGWESWLSPATIRYLSEPDPLLFFGTIAGDTQTGFFNILYTILLGLILWLSMAWPFTEEWGEYLALMFWATVGMMLLTAAEELITLFITLETMTICLYLATALEKTKRRSAEGGLKYFVYGSVSSALFLFGLSMIYGLTGTTQFEAIRRILAAGSEAGLSGNVAGATAILLMMVGFGFKVAAVPFHQWAPDAYEGAPAPVTAWIATGSKIASFVALMKVFLHALGPWSNPSTSIMGPGWVGVIAIISAVTMTYGNFAALAQRNLKRMLAYSSIAHAGYILVGVAAASVATGGPRAAGAVLYYLVVYAFANVGAFAVAAWLVRDKNTDDIDDLNGLGFQQPMLAVCILVLMLSLIGIPPLAGFFGKLYVFMEALDERQGQRPIALIWLVALGLFNSVVSAFYYVRVLKAMFLRSPSGKRLGPATRPVAAPIAIATIVVVVFGVMPDWLVGMMQAAAVPMLTTPASAAALGLPVLAPNATATRPRPPAAMPPMQYNAEQMKRMRDASKGAIGPPATKGAFPKAAGKGAFGKAAGKGAFGKAAGKRGFGKGAPKGAPPKRDSGDTSGNPAAGESASPPATKGN